MSWEAFGFHTVAYVVALWLGGFLLARDPRNPALRNAGLGLLAFAVGLGGLLLVEVAAVDEERLVRLTHAVLFLPAILWAGALVHVMPEETPFRRVIATTWRYTVPVLVVGFLVVGGLTDLVFATDGSPQGGGYAIAATIALLPLGEALSLIGFGLLRAGPRRLLGLLMAALLLFTLSSVLLLVPTDALPRELVLASLGIDLLLLGLALAALDAFSEGHAWLPELLRSLVGTVVAVLLFVGPVLVMLALTDLDDALVAVMLVVAASAVLTQTFADQFQALLDNLAYRRFPRIRQVRSQQRAEAVAEARISDALEPRTMDTDEFARLTRQALRELGNLPKLAASPLTRLSLVEPGETLERAGSLRQLLIESIDRLRPDGAEPFQPGEPWRFFNALHYPYVVGLRPYSRRAVHNGLAPDARAALDWFQVQVPERTLYNWQSAATQLVAQDLLDRTGSETGS